MQPWQSIFSFPVCYTWPKLLPSQTSALTSAGTTLLTSQPTVPSYKTNLDRVLSSIATNKDIDDYGFYRFSYGQGSDTANAIGLCRTDVKLDACRSCLSNSIHLLTNRCPNQKEAIGCYENCSLHYSSPSLSDQIDIGPMFRLWSTRNVTNIDQFVPRLRIILLKSLKMKASSAGNVPSSELETISGQPSTDTASRQVGKKNVKTRVHIVIILVLSVVSCWVLITCIYMFLRSRKIEGAEIESN